MAGTPSPFFIPEPKKLARNEKIVLYLCRKLHITALFLAGNDNPYRNIDDCLAMGHARETWRIYTAEMLCVVSNPVREAFVIYNSVIWKLHATSTVSRPKRPLQQSEIYSRTSNASTPGRTDGAGAASGPIAGSTPGSSRVPSPGARERPQR